MLELNSNKRNRESEVKILIRKENGITLLALIITVVIMIILAAVTINVTLGDGGLVQQAKHAAEQTANATKSEQEQLEDAASKVNEIIAGIGSGGDITNSTGGEDTNQVGETNTVDTNSVDTNSVEETNTVDTNTIEPEPEPLPDGTITIGEPQWQGDGTANVSVTSSEGGYIIQYQINGTKDGSWLTVQGGIVTGVKHGDTVYARLTDGEQYSDIQNKKIEDTIPPQVTVTAQGSPSTNSIVVTVQTEDVQSGMADELTYTYYIKQSTEPDSNYNTPDGASNITNNTYNFTGLTQGTSYDIKVEVNGDKAGNKGIGTLANQTTQTVPGADEGLETGAITASPVTWENEKAKVTLTSNATDSKMQIEYQINTTNEEDWKASASPVTVSNLNHGDTVYARLTDGSNVGASASINILDTEKPVVSNISVDEVTSDSIKVTVTASDSESGLADTGTYRYYLNNEESPRVTSSNNTYTYEGLSGGTQYNIKVEVVDKGNNMGTDSIMTMTSALPYVDSVLPSAPMLSDGMTPVKWNGSNWVRTTASDNEWYDYENKKWANIVLGDATFNKDVLDESKPYSMLVWIPRYAYQITSQYHQEGEGKGNINIVFIDTNNQNKDKTKTYSEIYPSYNTGSGMSDYVVHPAFNYGDNKEHKLSGLWVGKFETSNTSCTTNSSSGEYNGTDRVVQIKANVTSWREVNVSNIYTICTDMNKSGNIYKLNIADSKVDPHMLKNTEWGAVAYLSQNTAYGKGSEVWINPNMNYITGQVGNSASEGGTYTTSAYNFGNGPQASTTGNVTGIYDMSGGAAELVAAYIEGNNASSYGANLINAINKGAKRYAEVYDADSKYTTATPKEGYYGDAVYETSSGSNAQTGQAWYNDSSLFPYNSSNYPYGVFFLRGGFETFSKRSGIYAFGDNVGTVESCHGFRVCITVIQ